ncbi:MAG: formate dehydrogenase subunit alpha [Thermomicrobiales bacterium]
MEQPNVAIRINSDTIRGQQGEPLIAALQRAGIDLPAVCYHPSLGPIQTCDTCWVEVDGHVVRACATAVRDGMTAHTDAAPIRAAREEGMQRLLKNHELYCTVCENNNGNCTVHNTTAMMGIAHQEYPFTTKPYAVDDSNPFYRYDPDQCILCGRCVEACQNLQVNETLTIDWSMEQPRVLWDGGAPINESSCVSCGHCVTVCPCNALIETSMLGHVGFLTGLPDAIKRPMIEVVKAVEPHTGYIPIMAISDAEAAMRANEIKKTKTVCTYCGVGCSFEMWTMGRKILKVEPNLAAPANGISTCIKGKFGWDFINSPERLTTPLIREGDRFREASWEEAIATIARRLSEIKARHGPDSIGLIASSKCTNEEAYLVQKLARAVVGTNNVDNCSRYCQAPATTGLFRTVGYGGDSGSISDIEAADLVLIVGSNTAESHPVIATRIKRAHKLRGQQLVVMDLREHEMAERADLFLRPHPGTDMVWLSAITKFILDHGLADQPFLDTHVTGLDEYRASLEPFTLAFAERVTTIPQTDLERLARMIAASPSVCALWAMGVTQHMGGSDTSTALSNLLLVTGNYGRPGTGGYPMRGHNNVQGTSDFGALPAFFPGYERVADDGVRARYEQGWGVTLPTGPGLDNHEMVDAIRDGTLKAMYVIGEDMSLVDSNIEYVQEQFEALEFFVVQDLFLTRTAQFADVVLPASPSLEKEGTFTNTERRIQRLYRVMEPLGGSRPDWQIIQAIAQALGADWQYAHPAAIMHEAAGLAPLFAGVTYERLEGWGSLQWPVAADGTDSPLLYTDGFMMPGGKAYLFPMEWIAPSDQPDDAYDLHLNNGRLLEHFHEGNLTGKSDGIRAKVPTTFVEVSPQLAAERGIEDGTLVRLISRRGALKVPVLVTDRVQGHELYMPMNSTDEPVNVLTSSKTDRATHTPAYKEVAVRMEVIAKSGGTSPLPRGNPRHGHRTPTSGVEVEKKWARPDYAPPTLKAGG